MNKMFKKSFLGLIALHLTLFGFCQNVQTQLENIAPHLPFANLSDSLIEKASLLKHPLLPAEQQKVISDYNALKKDYQEQIFSYLALKNNDTSSFLVLHYYFHIQKDSGLLRKAVDFWSSKNYKSFYTQYTQEELNGADSAVVGKQIPAMTLWDKNNVVQLLPTHKKSLLIFWASWCIPCRAENRDIKSKYPIINDKGLSVISINLDERQSDWLKASKQDQISWIDWFAGDAWNSRVARFFTIHQIPQNVLLDENGVILARNIRLDRLY